VVGVGESALGLVPDRSSHSLAAEAVLAALEDAGLTKDDVDGLITMPSFTEPRTRHAVNLAQYLGLRSDRVQWLSSSMHGSTISSGVGLHEACMAVASGACECVVFVSADNLRSAGSASSAISILANNRDPQFENPYGTLIPGTFGLIAQRYMHDCDVTEEDLARVTVAARLRASHQPKAHMYRQPVTVEDVLASPMVASPLRRLNCALVSDGGAALVVTSPERATDLRQSPVVVAGLTCVYGESAGFVTDDLGQLPNLATIRTGTARAARESMSQAGIKLSDVGYLATYDPFSFYPLMVFEGLGYCGPGEGGVLVRDGFLDSGRGRWWNTHGGLMAYCHPGTAGGLFMIVEAVRQLRGQAVYDQLSDPSVALVQGYGANKGTFPSTVLTVNT
jgi:acetyl-CoA acetyltransferase